MVKVYTTIASYEIANNTTRLKRALFAISFFNSYMTTTFSKRLFWKGVHCLEKICRYSSNSKAGLFWQRGSDTKLRNWTFGQPPFTYLMAPTYVPDNGGRIIRCRLQRCVQPRGSKRWCHHSDVTDIYSTRVRVRLLLMNNLIMHESLDKGWHKINHNLFIIIVNQWRWI